ncbi:MAG: NAD-binding protein [Ornithinimicrobium sp.]|uniref:potassium channel family protein n=1 Tax=Ornithinimicrobium sp. TaxID=1977084 RepID=UPI0026E02B8A|nr:potassium channel protein [Ornithinimicrobium sp.]MDO5739292.1 NAD-binding protein [Ornithinimicrobium sp.]
MVNLLQLLQRGKPARNRPDSLRRVRVDVPDEPPTTDAVFLVLRGMRVPLVAFVSVFSLMSFGLSLMPGTAENPQRLTLFDSFYIVSYTGMTIGFGEIPYEFSYPQRLWVILTIYSCVLVWTYSAGVLLTLSQEKTFRLAISLQRFRRRVRNIQNPFVLVVGYGQAGEAVCRALQDQGREFVVIDSDPDRVQRVAFDGYRSDIAAYAASGRDPRILGMAGLGHDLCEAVLALTDNDETNLSVVMSVNLLRPELMVIARCSDRERAQQMHDFAADVIINPFDRYGAFLVMALRRPSGFRLASWLMSPRGTELPEKLERLDEGRWVVCADGSFGAEVTRDLESAGLDVDLVDPAYGRPDVSDAVGFIAGAESDIINMAMAAHARIENDALFIAIRQNSAVNEAPLRAFDADSVFVPTELLAREAVARITSPNYWSFIDHVLHEDDKWDSDVLEDIVNVVGDETPSSLMLSLEYHRAPAAVRWMRHSPLTLGDLLRDPDDWDTGLAAFPAVLVRDGRRIFVPDLDLDLREGDQILLLGQEQDLDIAESIVFHDSAVEYVVTGREVATAWAFRQVQKQIWRRRARRAGRTAA